MIRESIIITGGTRGIGFATALKYAGQNISIILTYKNNLYSSKLAKLKLQKVHKNFHIIKCDPNNISELNKLTAYIKTNKLKIKTLINNQGSTKYVKKDKKKIDINLFMEMLNINLLSHLKIINVALPFMKKGASIINVSSIASINGKGSNIGYCASKSAIDSVTRSLSQSLSPKIRVNSICPGLTQTDMTTKAPKNYFKNQISITPMNRLARPEDIANAIFSISEHATFINGQCIVVDGGRMLY
ncbi:SDR family oxidoreductase [Pelagibacteraceae bacterium]|nr:SDR family oxidoreductase [Pelagibacteraceae bacterium]